MVIHLMILSFFREMPRMFIAKINNYCYQVFPYIDFFIEPVLMVLSTQDTLNKGIVLQTTEERVKILKK